MLYTRKVLPDWLNRINGSGGEDIAKAILSHHTSAEDVGRIAKAAKSEKLVLST